MSRRWARPASALLLCTLVSACSWQRAAAPIPEKTLADLQPVSVPVAAPGLVAVDLEQLAALYREALAASDDPEIRRQVKDRLASLEVQRSEDRLIAGDSNPALFDGAIVAYRDILADNPGGPQEAHQMYQLAKAYELNGQDKQALTVMSELAASHPESDRYIEAEFRLAESAFAAASYTEAGRRYAQVIAGGRSAYYQNAHYMLAWSRFKAADYSDAIRAYIDTVDLMVGGDIKAASFGRGDQELLDDCFRMLSVSFATLGGVEDLSLTTEQIGERSYTPKLYAGLAQYYLKLERYQESADSYRAFIKAYPDSDEAYRYHVAEIDVYKKGGFSREVLASKRDFVTAYQHSTSYWQSRHNVSRRYIDIHLQQYMVELAAYYHTLAQAEAKKTATDKSRRLKSEHYSQAAHYYSLFVDSFPSHARAPEMMFLLAESQHEAGNYGEAIASYEVVAYEYTRSNYAVEAGYAAILGYDKLPRPSAEGVGAEQAQQVADDTSNRKVVSSLRFARTFPRDKRTPSVLVNASESLLQLKNFSGAIAAAEQLTMMPAEQQSLLPIASLLSAWLVIGQGAFDSGDYLYAESAYGQALPLLPAADKRRADVIDNMAASIYKQAELAQQQGNFADAAEQYLRVVEVAPDSKIRITAQYDAANCYLELEDWPRAVQQLQDFRRRFPADKLAATVSVKLSLAYQEQQQWSLAATELLDVYDREQEPAKKAQLLYLTAELYERAQDNDQAIEYYRRYAHAYPEPFDINIEAMQKLSDLYLQQDDSYKRRFWLRKVIQADSAAGEQRSERSRYLAAQASAVFADDAYREYVAIKLTLPIKKSFNKKKSALDQVIKRYKATADYGIAEFSTQSSYRLAEVYAQLSRDLMDSERPAGLDELALEEYEILLEEQAYPFEEKAIAIHEKNIQSSWQGFYNDWVKKSFAALQQLLPARYSKRESSIEISEGIY